MVSVEPMKPVENVNLNRDNPPLGFVGEANFDSQVLHSNGSFLVAFWAPWSKPCQVIDPVLLEVAQAWAGGIEVVKVNADDNPNLSLRFEVQYIPTLLHFTGGELRGRLIGTASKAAILNLLSPDSKAGGGNVSLAGGETV